MTQNRSGHIYILYIYVTFHVPSTEEFFKQYKIEFLQKSMIFYDFRSLAKHGFTKKLLDFFQKYLKFQISTITCAWCVQILFGKIKCWEQSKAVLMVLLKRFCNFYSRRYCSTKICKNLIFWKILKWLINAKNQKITYLSVWQKFLPKLGTLSPQTFSTNI